MRTLSLFLFSFLVGVALSQDPKKNPLDFVFKGDCPSEYETCLPYSKLSFRKELSAVSDDEAVRLMNDFVARNPQIFLKPIEVYKIDSKSRNFGVRMREPVKKREAYLNITFDHMICSDDINFDLMFPSLSGTKFPKLPSFNDSFYRLGDKTGYLPDAFRFMTNFLFHMYHLNESFLRDSLVGLPLDFSNAPIMTMIPPEFTIFKDTDVSRFTLMFRRETFEAFEYYNEALEKAWSKTERKLFFNNRVKISLDDFSYAFFVMRSRALSFQKQKKIAMIPVHFAAKNNDNVLKDNDERYLGQMIDFHYRIGVDQESNESKHLAVMADHSFEKEEPIILNYKTGNTLDLFLFLGLIVKKNPNDCYEHPLFDEKALLDLKLTLNRCFRIKDLKRAYLIANLMNMDDGSVADCKEKTSKAEWNSDEFYKILDEQCVHPKWSKKNDIWIGPINTLEDNQEKLEGMITTAVDYLNYRRSKKFPTELGEQIRTFLERKMELLKTYLKEIKELKKYSKQKQKEQSKKKTEL